MVAVVMAAGMVYTTMKPDGYEEHRTELMELFNLPDNAEFVDFRSPYGRGGLQFIEGVVQFTPDQWATYTATLDHSTTWNPKGFTYREHTVTAEPDADAIRWHDGEYAWIGDGYAAFWLNWGFGQSKALQGKPSVGHAKAWKSFCWVVVHDADGQNVESCRDYKHGPKGRKFYVRAKLERENHRLFMYVR